MSTVAKAYKSSANLSLSSAIYTTRAGVSRTTMTIANVIPKFKSGRKSDHANYSHIHVVLLFRFAIY